MWYFAFGISAIAISKLSLGDFGSGKRIAYGLVCAQILYVLARNAEFTDTMRVLVNRAIGRVDNRISYSRFYSEPLFRGIESAIGKPKETYRVVSIGLHPGIAIYNGFYTLDFYSVNYPLSYKHKFRHLIESELAKNSKWRLYYDGWGSRCYVFVDELESCMTTKYDKAKVEHLAFNTQMFKSMGGVYIFSAAEIVNHAENSLSFAGVFEDFQSPWRIYLYKAE